MATTPVITGQAEKRVLPATFLRYHTPMSFLAPKRKSLLTMPRLQTLLACLLLMLAHHTMAQSAGGQTSLLTLSRSTSALPAQPGQADVAAANWQLLTDDSVYLTPVDGHSWIRLTVHNPDSHSRRLLVQLANTEVPGVSAWILTDDRQPQPLYGELGLNHAFNARPVHYRHVLYPLMLAGGQSQTLLLRIDHYFAFKLTPALYDEQQFLTRSSRELVFFGMLYGAIAMIVIYNLFMYWSLREKSQLLYLLFGSFTGLFIAMQEGHFYQFIASQYLWPKETFYAVVTALMGFCFTFFTVYFLDLQRWSSWLMRLVLAVGSLTALFLILLGINQQPVILSHYSLLLIITLYCTAIAAALHVWHHKVSSAGFFALAIFLCTLGMLAEFSAQLPFIPWSHASYGFSSAGNVAMILVFAFALADKMRGLQQEKLRSSMKLFEASQEKAQNNLELYKNRLHELQKENAANEARVESRARSEFLATMSHEIRTPMNSVLGITELLEDTELDKKQRHYVNSINNAAKSLLNVINDLLDYSRIQSGQMALDTRVFNLEKILDDCISIFSLRASEAKLSFIGLIEPGTPLQFRGDPDKIRQVVLNLLSNAFSFTSEGDIHVHVEATGKNTVNSMELRFAIVSKGVALASEDQQALFEPFTGQASKKQHGHELGLTVSRELVELMQGHIGVDVDHAQNSTTLWFTCRLLLPHQDEQLALPDRSQLLSGRRMLICDPNPDFVHAVSTLTRSWNMQVHAVASSLEASNRLLDDPQAYQVLMIAEEYLTPEVQLAIRQSNVDHNFITSIIVTTRTRFALTAEEMKKQGIQFILEKPWTTRQLYKALLYSMGIENPAKQLPQPALQALHVMIAEDNTINLMVMDGLLKKLQLNPVIAHNGREAVDSYQHSESGFDVIFMDCEMPDMDGYEATAAIRELEQGRGRQSIIIGLSAHTNPSYQQRAREAGMDDFIVKPVNREHVESLVSAIRNGEFRQPNHSDIRD